MLDCVAARFPRLPAFELVEHGFAERPWPLEHASNEHVQQRPASGRLEVQMRCLQEFHPFEEPDSAARGRGAYLVALTTSGAAVFDRLALTAGITVGDK